MASSTVAVLATSNTPRRSWWPISSGFAERYSPDRDILVALTADEESGNANGAVWLTTQRPDLMDVAYCINTDAGGGFMEKGKRLRMAVQTSERVYTSFRIAVRSEGGHSSLPTDENAIYRLSAGLMRLAQYRFPFRFNETTHAYFERLSRLETGTLAAEFTASRNLANDSGWAACR